MITQTCLAQVLHFDRPRIHRNCKSQRSITLGDITSSFPLAQYAAASWVAHFHSAGADTIHYPRLLKLLLKLFALPQTYAMICWVLMDGPGRRHRQESISLEDVASPLYYACLAGLTQVGTHLINNGADINAAGGRWSTPLMAAIREGHLELATMLVEKGANVDADGGQYGRALQAASAGGSSRVRQAAREGCRYQYQGRGLVPHAVAGIRKKVVSSLPQSWRINMLMSTSKRRSVARR